MSESKKEEIKSEARLLWEEAKKLIENGDISIPKDLKESFLKIDELGDKEQFQLISDLSKRKNEEKLPEIIINLIELVEFKKAPPLSKLSEEMFSIKFINSYLDDETRSKLLLVSREVNTLFNKDKVFTKFLQHIVYGEQDKVEKLFKKLTEIKQTDEIQRLICKTGTVIDYSGRKFHCTAYEYAYWAKDKHMCRMLEQYMDENTKAEMLKRCMAIEKNGLKYTQNGKDYCTSHFDFTPLKEALEKYIDKCNESKLGSYEPKNQSALLSLWRSVGLAQRDVPVHVINEYCRLDRSFKPTPTFDEKELPRVLTFYNYKTERDELVFPLTITEFSGLGVDFGLVRGHFCTPFLSEIPEVCAAVSTRIPSKLDARVDWRAVEHLEEVRTEDLKQSLKNLEPKKQEHKLSL